MSEVRCPMCGNLNLADAEVCRVCSARLKPLIISSSSIEETKDQSGEKSNSEDIYKESSQISEWLQKLKDSEQEQGISQLPKEPSVTERNQIQSSIDQSDWLEGLRIEGSQEIESSDLSEEAFLDEAISTKELENEDVPDWLKAIRSDQDIDEHEHVSHSQIDMHAEEWMIPQASIEWLENSEHTQDDSENTEIFKETASENDKPLVSSMEEKSSSNKKTEATIQNKEANEQNAREEASTSRDVGKIFQQEETEDINISQSDIPDWLEKIELNDLEAQEVSSDEATINLAKADIPTWLQELHLEDKEIQAASEPAVSEELIGFSGPLNGLAEALPLEQNLSRPKKPEKYGLKLQVSEKQQSYVAAIEEMNKREGQSLTPSIKSTIKTHNLFRIVIFFLLIFAALLPKVIKFPQTALPFKNQSIYDLAQTINRINIAKPVLIAIDYEPGFSGEMELASKSVVNHLMLKKAILVLVSTLPSGPVQGQRLINIVNIDGKHNYTEGVNFINLGYIPGGVTGITGFSNNPKQIMPLDVRKIPAWNNSELTGINRLGDFSLITILTSNPDTARSWIEQVKPIIGEIPLIVVASAQAEPAIRPYDEGEPRQVNGMVAGLLGGISYEELMPQKFNAANYLHSYSFVILILCIIVFIGGFIGLINYLKSNNKMI